MTEIRFHGRGGQGTVLAVKMLADAVLRSGRAECMAIPEFGVERRGAPVRAYARVSPGKILVRTKIYEPDIVVVMDPAFATDDSVAVGLKKGGMILINSDTDQEALAKKWAPLRVVAFSARSIALAHGLGSAASPMVNTPMMGALCAVTGIADLEHLADAIKSSVPAKIAENIAAAREAFAACKKEKAHAAS